LVLVREDGPDDAQYAKIADAYRHDSPAVVLELRTPDSSVQMPNGERWDAEQSAAYVKAGFEQVKQTWSTTNCRRSCTGCCRRNSVDETPF